MLLLLANGPNRLPRGIDLKQRLKSFMLALSLVMFTASRELDSEQAGDTRRVGAGRLHRRHKGYVDEK